MTLLKISVIIPCYNQGAYLDDSLNSVFNQVCHDWECIIVDDGSTDDTRIIAKKWLDRDLRFRYFYKVNGGVSQARNFGIEQARGEIILPLDADDKIGPEYLKLSIDEFKKNDQLKLVYCKAQKFGINEEYWDLPSFNLQRLALDNMIFCCAFFKKSDWQKTGGYDKNMDDGFEDWEFWIALLKNGGQVIRLDYLGFYYRIKDGSRTKKINQRIRNSLFKYISVKHADFFVKQLGSFFYLRNEIASVESKYKEKLRSEKYVIDLFLYRFFKVTIFGKYKP